MREKTLNQRLGMSLARIMKARELSANRLGAMANVASNTINNYLRATDREPTPTPTTGKERSAKLTEVEKIARALEVPALELLTGSPLSEMARDIADTFDRLMPKDLPEEKRQFVYGRITAFIEGEIEKVRQAQTKSESKVAPAAAPTQPLRSRQKTQL